MSANQIRKEGLFVRVEGPQSNVVWLNILDAQEAVRLLAAPPSEAPAKYPCACGNRAAKGEHGLERCVWDDGGKYYPPSVAAARPEAYNPIERCTACACERCQAKYLDLASGQMHDIHGSSFLTPAERDFLRKLARVMAVNGAFRVDLWTYEDAGMQMNEVLAAAKKVVGA